MHSQKLLFYNPINPPIHEGRGGAVRPPVIFGPFPKKSSGNPYLKILNFSQLFIADAPMKKKRSKIFKILKITFFENYDIFKMFFLIEKYDERKDDF